VGELNEKSLHAALKTHFASPRSQLEARVNGFIVDIVEGAQLVEIQTKGLAAIKRKLAKLLSMGYELRLVYPIPRKKWIIKYSPRGSRKLDRRKSPKEGTFYDLFFELVSLAEFVRRPNFTLEALLIDEEEVREYVGKERLSWRRRGWRIKERRLLDIAAHWVIDRPEALNVLLPPDLPSPFTTKDLARLVPIRLPLAQKMAYCLRVSGSIEAVGKQGNAILYSIDADGESA